MKNPIWLHALFIDFCQKVIKFQDLTKLDYWLDIKIQIETKDILAIIKLYCYKLYGLTCADHFAGRENQRRRPGITNSHDHSGKPLWIVLSITRVHGDFLQVQLATVQINCGDDILEARGFDAKILRTAGLRPGIMISFYFFIDIDSKVYYVLKNNTD